MSVHIGVSGWSYPHWRGSFYPEKLAARRQLSFLSEQFDSVEINRSFYSLLTPDTCLEWYEQTPRGFLFALKGSRFITHMKKPAFAKLARQHGVAIVAADSAS